MGSVRGEVVCVFRADASMHLKVGRSPRCCRNFRSCCSEMQAQLSKPLINVPFSVCRSNFTLPNTVKSFVKCTLELLGSSSNSSELAAVFLKTPFYNRLMLDLHLGWCYGTLVLILNVKRGANKQPRQWCWNNHSVFPDQYLEQKPKTASYLRYCCWSLFKSGNLQK